MVYIKIYFSELLGLLNQMSPYLMSGFFLAGLLHVLVPQRHVVRYLGGKNFRSVINAAFIGVPLPLCSCGVVPTGLSFHRNGASKGSSVSFLISTPQTGPDSIMVTYSMLGLPFAVLRPFIALITGILGGWFTNRVVSGEKPESGVVQEDIANSRAFKNPVKEMIRYAFIDFLQDISKWLVIGLFLAALISVIIPDGFLTRHHTGWMIDMLLALVISGPLYVCATGSVPIAAVLLLKGLSPGAALVFLMAGPATNATTMTMVGKVLGRKSLITYLISTIGGALIFGSLIDMFLPREWFLYGLNMLHSTSHHSMELPIWLQYTSSTLLILLILNTFRIKYFPRKNHGIHVNTLNIDSMKTATVKVQGMTCNHCKATVENNLKNLPGIKEVEANLQTEMVSITADEIDLERIKSTVEGLGYQYAGERS